MRRNQCPECGAPINFLHSQWKQSWRLQSARPGILCAQCGALLHWSIGQWIWLHNTLLAGGGVTLAYLFFVSESPNNHKSAILMVTCFSISAVMLVVGWLTRRLVIEDDDRPES